MSVSRPRTRSLLVEAFDANLRRSFEYDALLFSIGYEARSVHIAKHSVTAKELVGCTFRQNRVLAFDDNRSWADRHGVKVVDDVGGTDFIAWIAAWLESICDHCDHVANVAIDISSMSRLRIAAVVDACRMLRSPAELRVTFLYAPAKFHSSPTGDYVIKYSDPVLETFSGWHDPARPTAAIVGLGYELERGIGAIENLEPAEAWAFAPLGSDARYREEMRRANELLWELLPSGRCIDYHVYRPFDCFVRLESLTHGLLRNRGVVLIPLGPKIFALTSLLVSCLHPEAAVWRVSSGGSGQPTEAEAVGELVGIVAVFGLHDPA